jgi:hypothetical protein
MPNVQPKTLKPGQRVLTAPATPGSAPVTANPGDVVTHASGAGWHIVTARTPITLPVGGYVVGASDDNVHWSTGPSYSGQPVPQTIAASASYDAVQSGIGTDGRASLDGTTYGGATGAAAGGVSGQATSGAGNTGGGGGSAARGF